jgi:hypothetical protein
VPSNHVSKFFTEKKKQKRRKTIELVEGKRETFDLNIFFDENDEKKEEICK